MTSKAQGLAGQQPERELFMSIKSKVLALTATLALAGGVGTAGVLGTTATANAATPSCGASCVDLFSYEFGHHFTPNFLLDADSHILVGSTE